jgi:hypothetical protein
MTSLKSLASALTVAATIAASTHAAFAATPPAQTAARAAQPTSVAALTQDAPTLPTTIGSARITVGRRQQSSIDPLVDFRPDYSRALTPAQFDGAYQAELARVYGPSFP